MWLPAFFGLAYPYLLLINILFILFWLFSKAHFAVISLVVIAVGYKHLNHYFQLSGKESDEGGIVFCSYNVKNFYGNAATSRDEVADSIFEYLQSKNADIICLQEGKGRFTQKNAMDKLSGTSKLKHMYGGKTGGPVTFSSFPIIHQEEVRFSNSSNMVIITDIKIDKDTVRLYNCHLQSYRFTDANINSLDSISFNKQQESYRKVRYTGSKLKQAFIKRAEQAETLHGLINSSPYDVIVCGDFNDTPVSYTYHTVSQGLEDAFVKSGSGIENTYMGKLPSFRIDYILHSPGFESFNFHVDKIEYSDHYPISCVLKKKN